MCPRECGADRASGKLGACGVSLAPRVARAALHMWEEPPISGDAGSGTIFFSGCPLRCVFCQNDTISWDNFGVEVSVERLAEMMCELEEQGALNINLVTALHFAPHIREAVVQAREMGMSLPIVCNTSGYELADLVRELSSTVDIWLTDFKYHDANLARDLSGAGDYPQVAAAALKAMHECTQAKGGRVLGEDGRMEQGIIVRHLVLPGHADDSCAVFDAVWDICGNDIDISVMNQYTPNKRVKMSYPDLDRAVGMSEYERVLDHCDDLGFERMWWQEGGTVSESFIPPFDLSGVVRDKEGS